MRGAQMSRSRSSSQPRAPAAVSAAAAAAATASALARNCSTDRSVCTAAWQLGAAVPAEGCHPLFKVLARVLYYGFPFDA